MSDPFIGEVRLFGGQYAPSGWALCNGQLVPIAQNEALFSLVGTLYGGDGVNTFALPDLRGRVPIGMGQGPGLGNHPQGEMLGQEQVTLLASQMPLHQHAAQAGTAAVSAAVGPTGAPGASSAKLYGDGAPSVVMSALAVGPSGGGQPHNNMAPGLVLNFIIALQGIYPSRS